eukprot:15436858-Alexandrium_andersonii.AAC.1
METPSRGSKRRRRRVERGASGAWHGSLGASDLRCVRAAERAARPVGRAGTAASWGSARGPNAQF